jgi:hypothetical protein
LFLSEDVSSTIAHASRFDQQNLCVVSEQIEKNIWIIRVVIDQPWQPTLHAIEHLALRKSLPLLPPPRLGSDKGCSTLTHFLGGKEFATRKNCDFGNRNGCALVGDRKFSKPIDFVSPKIDSHWNIGGTRIDIDNRTADRDFTAVLNLHLSAISESDESFDQFDRISDVANTNRDRFDFTNMRPKPLNQRPNRRHDYCRGPFRFVKSPQHS